MSGFFVGRSTYDLDFVTSQYPPEDTKLRAEQLHAMAGGPGLNASVVFAALGYPATLYSVIGSGRFADAAREDIGAFGVRVIDAAAGQVNVLPISSVVANRVKATRTIVSSETHPDLKPAGDDVWRTLDEASIVLIDGHIPGLALPVIREAKARKIPVVMDGGTYREAHADLLPYVDAAVVSEQFLPPGCETGEDVFRALSDLGIPRIAITRGPRPLSWREEGREGEIVPPEVKAVDTLGAGDIFHGAFCWHYLTSGDFVDALRCAGEVAAFSTTMWGTRSWIPAWLEKLKVS